jgi:hypothetical protein
MVAKAYSSRRNPLGLTPMPTLALMRDEPPPPSGALINVILEYADIQHDAGRARRVLRLSHKRMKDPVIRAMLGREAKRLQDISILWDEEEGEIIRVHDAATGEDTPFEAARDVMASDTFELTEAALAYIAAYPTRK